jgi:5'-3' exonuclease
LFQLLDEKTRIYSLHKKVYLTADNIKEEFNIHMNNFALAKAMCGDASDNIPGIKGLGFKTLAKRFPIFASETDLMIDDVVSYSHARLKESTAYKHVVESVDLIRRNWQLVYLGDQSMASHQTEKVDQVIETFKPSANKIEFIRRLIAEGIQGFEVDDFFLAFLCVSYV